MFSRWLQARAKLVKWLPWAGWALVFVVILADLFVGRYRVIGPSVFGFACGLAGVGLGRFLGWGMSRQPRQPEPAEPSEQAHLLPFLLLWSVVGWVVGLACLAGPIGHNVPENASFAWSFPPGQEPIAPADQPYIWWSRIRFEQCFVAPIFLFIGGAATALSPYWFFYSMHPQRKPRADQDSSTPEATGGAATGPNPCIVVVALSLFLIFILITIWQL